MKQSVDLSSILDMAMGAIEERVDYEMGHIVDNILDPNTEAKKKRKLVLTLEFQPDSNRQVITVSTTAKSALVPTDPVMTTLYVAAEPGTGQLQVVEMVPQVPGQMALDGDEQDEAKVLKFERA